MKLLAIVGALGVFYTSEHSSSLAVECMTVELT